MPTKRAAAALAAVAAALLVASAGCGRRARHEGALSLDSLRNATYLSDYGPDSTVHLSDGRWDDPEENVSVVLSDYIAWGDVTGDGRPDAAVVLETASGGTGDFRHVALVVDRGGHPVNVGVALLGDRVRVKMIAVEHGEIVIEMIAHGPGEPLCCPTQRVRLRYVWHDGALEEVTREDTRDAPDGAPAGAPAPAPDDSGG